MLSKDEKETFAKFFNVNRHGLANMIRSIAKIKNISFYDVSKEDLYEIAIRRDEENCQKRKINKILRDNNYQGKYEFILSTV